VVAEVRGRELPDEVVLLGAHLDSWDLATGAVDDGAGIVIVMEAGRLIARLPQAPRRTVRVVLYMNEENGGRGGKGYAEAHRAELGLHVAAMEADSGAGRPLALSVRAGPGAVELFKPWLAPLETLGLGTIAEGGEGGADIHPLGEASVPFISVQQDSSHYFDLHHSAADTFDKVEPQALAASAAAFAWMAYAAAEMPKAPSRPPPAGERTRPVPVPPARH
jgi:Zn-dependent M28 family amino/carboxypeptidase